MSNTTENTTIRAKTNDPKNWQLLQINVTTGEPEPISLSGVSEIELRFVNESGAIVKTFKLTDNPTKISITDTTNGKIKFSPATTDFVSETLYYVYILVTYNTGIVFSVPEEEESVFKVRTDFS